MPADEPIRLAPADPNWPARFEEEREALERAIGPWVKGGIHHVGSTAVPGLEAKPIIDILAGVHDLESARACFDPLAGLGYVYAPYLPGEMHWFCKPDPARRTHHLHLVPAGSSRFREELLFRDRLRADPKLAAEYAALKRDLAERHREDREAYTEAKGAFIRAVLLDGWGGVGARLMLFALANCQCVRAVAVAVAVAVARSAVGGVACLSGRAGPPPMALGLLLVCL